MTVFSKIVAGEIPSFKIAEDARFYAFLDIHPLQKGHTLVIPKKEVDYLFDLEDQDYKDLFLFAKRIAVALQKAFPCKKVGMAVMGLEVPHAHIHLVPLQNEGDLLFSRPKLELSADEFQAVAQAIRDEFE